MASDECSILLSSVDLLVLTSTESFMTEAHDESQLGLEDLGKGGDDSDNFLTGLLLLFFELPSTRHMGKGVESNAYKDKSWTESSTGNHRKLFAGIFLSKSWTVPLMQSAATVFA